MFTEQTKRREELFKS